MLERLLELMGDGEVRRLSDLSDELGVSQSLLHMMMADLERMGYLEQIQPACSGHCAGCPSGGVCVIMGGGAVWSLTDKGRLAVGRGETS